MAKKRKEAASLDERLSEAVASFWLTRSRQDRAQGAAKGMRDYGNRTAATGGKQFDSLNLLVAECLAEAGVPRECIHLVGRDNLTLPGYFRPTKFWDVVVVYKGALLAAFEAKALCGPSFGNNYNNRVEEALGSSTDIWTAYREGVFHTSPEPFVGLLFLLEEHPKSTRPVAVIEQHFPVSEAFRGADYVRRCEHSLRRMVRERCYNAAAFVLSPKQAGLNGGYSEPADDLKFSRFVRLMAGHVRASLDGLREP